MLWKRERWEREGARTYVVLVAIVVLIATATGVMATIAADPRTIALSLFPPSPPWRGSLGRQVERMRQGNKARADAAEQRADAAKASTRELGAVFRAVRNLHRRCADTMSSKVQAVPEVPLDGDDHEQLAAVDACLRLIAERVTDLHDIDAGFGAQRTRGQRVLGKGRGRWGISMEGIRPSMGDQRSQSMRCRGPSGGCCLGLFFPPLNFFPPVSFLPTLRSRLEAAQAPRGGKAVRGGGGGAAGGCRIKGRVIAAHEGQPAQLIKGRQCGVGDARWLDGSFTGCLGPRA